MMKIEQCRFGAWSAAYRCTVGACEMIVVADIGPRILSLRQRGGPNLLHEDATGFSVGDWRLYGGHRFTVAPEGSQSYTPDNHPCSVEVRGPAICFAGLVGANGLRRMLVIGPSANGRGFEIGHRLENHGDGTWRGALWAITCVRHEGLIHGACHSQRVRFWPDAERAHWHVASGQVLITPNGSRSKGGWYSRSAWVASAQAHATLVIEAASAPLLRRCVDGGCNVEVFTCADYVELETLSGEVALAPGERAWHRQSWHVLASPFDSRQLRSINTAASARRSSIHAA